MWYAEKIAEFVSETLGLCGYGKDNNWSVKIADFFFVDCGCCWFWRGVLFGAFFSLIAFAILYVIISSLMGL